MQQMSCSEDTGSGPRENNLSPVSDLPASPGAGYLLCLCLQLWFGLNSFQGHSLDGWKGKLPSCAPAFLRCMKHCRWARATFLPLLPPPLTGLEGRVGMRSKRLSTAAKHGCAAWPGMSRRAVGTSPGLILLCGVVCMLGEKRLASVTMALLEEHQNVWGLQ